jgi:hypothetical protein
MNSELPVFLHRWRDGNLTPDEMRRLTALLAQPEARAALRHDWFLEAALPQALATSSVIVRTPQPSRPAAPVFWRWTPAQWVSVGAAAVICLGCFLWEHLAAEPEDTDVFAARLAAASLEP